MLRARRSNLRRVQPSSMGSPRPSTGSHVQHTESAGDSAPRTKVSAHHARCRATNIPPNMLLERTLNQVTLFGKVSADPMKSGTIEHPMVVFYMVTERSYKKAEVTLAVLGQSIEPTQRTDWHRICVFEPSLGEKVFTSLKRGQPVYVTGQIFYLPGEQDNVTKYRASIYADKITF